MHECRHVLISVLLLLMALAGFSSVPLVFIQQPEILSASTESPVDLHIHSDSKVSGRLTAMLESEDGLLAVPVAAAEVELKPGDNSFQLCIAPNQLASAALGEDLRLLIKLEFPDGSVTTAETEVTLVAEAATGSHSPWTLSFQTRPLLVSTTENSLFPLAAHNPKKNAKNASLLFKFYDAKHKRPVFKYKLRANLLAGDNPLSITVPPSVVSSAKRLEATSVTALLRRQNRICATDNALLDYDLFASASCTPVSADPNTPVAFSSSARGGFPPYTYAWDFGDGATSNVPSPVHSYASPASYNAYLTLTDSILGQVRSAVPVVIVDALSGTATATPSTGQSPLSVVLSATATGGTPPYTYSWDFRDVATAPMPLQTAGHIFAEPGTYTPVATITDAFGASVSVPVSTSVTVNPAVGFAASASANPLSGPAPLQTSFSAAASGGTPPYTYSWTFGDGASGSGETASHTYAANGTYPATLSASDSVSHTASTSITITVGQAQGLTVTATADPASGAVPLSVNFTASAAGGTGPYSYAWDFGDGATGTGSAITHAYTTTGDYTANVTVTDSASLTGAASQQISVTQGGGLSISLSAHPTTGPPPLTPTFTASASGGKEPYTYSWVFGDGDSGSGATVSHTYSTTGQYRVTCMATDSDGAVATGALHPDVTVTTSSPVLTIAVSPATGQAPLPVNFTANTTGGYPPYVYSWDFGDATTDRDDPAPAHTYDVPGTYTTHAVVTDANGNSAEADSAQIIVSPAVLRATATADPASGPLPLTVSFTASATGGVAPYSFSWRLGDGLTASGASVSHVYSSTGNFTAILGVTDHAGATGSATVAISVGGSQDALQVTATANPTSGTPPLSVSLSAAASGGTAPYTYAWTCGDGASGSGQTYTYAYTTAGSYTPAITVTDSAGHTASANAQNVNVSAQQLVGNANANPLSGNAPLTVNFAGAASGGIPPYTWSWLFGDGSPNGTGATASHSYASAGTYTATATVTDSASHMATATLNAQITVNPAGLSLTASGTPTTGQAPLLVNFSASASGGASPYTYTWDFGDGSAAGSGQNPSHTYTGGGTFTAYAVVTDAASHTAVAPITTPISVSPAPLAASATGGPTSGQAPLTVYFSGSATGGTPPYAYAWVFGDGGTSTLQNPNHTYSSAGTFAPTLTVTDNAARTANASGPAITVGAPAIAVTASGSPTSGQAPLVVSLNATASGGTPPYSYSWNFGDGSASGNGQNATHTYTSSGTFTALVTVTDSAAHSSSVSITTPISVNPSALTAAASATPTSGQAPLAVYFTGSASGGATPYTYAWNFGDGSSPSSQQNPVHTFSAAGTYTAVLTATDSAGHTATANASSAISVSPPALSISASCTPTSGQAPLAVSFTAFATGGTAPYAFSWTFGDGSPSPSGASVSHTYTVGGTFTAVVTVSDSASHTASYALTTPVTVSPPALSASASANPTSGQAPLAVYFTASASGGTPPYTWRWTFGDGSGPSTQQNPVHTYSSAGSFTASLTLTDSANQTTSASVPTAISVSPPALSITASGTPVSGQAPLVVSFTASASGGASPYAYSWSFGDGSPAATGASVSHSYSVGGTFTAVVTVSDSASHTASYALTTPVVVSPPALTASASANPTSGAAPLTVYFTGSASGGTPPYTYAWSFGDGGTSTGQNPSHAYSTAGSYTASVTVTDAASQSAIASVPTAISVGPSSVNLTASGSPTTGQAPLAVSFAATATGGIAPYTYSWNFGDGTTGTGANPSHTYTSGGTFSAIATATDTQGHSASATITTPISVSPPALSVTASGAPLSGSVPLLVYFTGAASGGTQPYTWSWTFGDGGTSTSQSPTHAYNTAGTYAVTLAVTDASSHTGSATLASQVIANPPGLTVTASGTPTSGTSPLAVTFAGSASGGTAPYTYSWDFGDGSSHSSSQNPSHTYNGSGTFTAYLTVTDSASRSAVAAITTPITVSPAPLSASVVATPTSGTAPLSVAFQGSATGGVQPYSYSYAFGDGGTAATQSSNHTYNSAGTYTVTLTVTDGASSTATANASIVVTTAFSVAVTANPVSGNAPLAVSFTSTPSGGSSPYTYSWTFGDGGTGAAQNPSHTYTAAGTYTATCTVRDSVSRTASNTASITVGGSALSVTSTANPASGQAPLAVSFTSTASGGTAPYTYSWIFGDGSSGSSQNPSHTYTTAGTYTATVTVTDSALQTASKSQTISVTSPPSLSVTAYGSPTSGQPPLAVTFSATASGGTAPYSYSWAFGDGATGSGQTASHTYNTAGSYSAVVTAMDSASHTANATVSITVSSVTPLSVTASGNPTSGQAPLNVSFTSNASGGTAPYSYTWTYGDAASGSGQNPSHSYTAAGNYTATVTVTDSASRTGSANVSIMVSASTPLSVTGSASPASGQAPLVVGFTCIPSGGTPPYTYAWTFGDGGTSTQQNPSHTFTSAGTYAARVTVTDSASHSASWSTNITVQPAPLTINCVPDRTTCTATCAITFTSTGSGGVPPYSYTWSLNNNTYSTGTSVWTHQFTTPGIKLVTAWVTDSTGQIGSQDIYVTIN